jgi:hypothetical protein
VGAEGLSATVRIQKMTLPQVGSLSKSLLRIPEIIAGILSYSCGRDNCFRVGVTRPRSILTIGDNFAQFVLCVFHEEFTVHPKTFRDRDNTENGANIFRTLGLQDFRGTDLR